MSNLRLFRLFAGCIVVKGAKRSAIYDLQRSAIETIPNSLADILTVHKYVPYSELALKLNKDEVTILDSYFNFLLEHEFGFWCHSIDEANRFPELTTNWRIPYKISNAILDFDSNRHYDIVSAIKKVIELGVPNIQFRFYNPFSLGFIDNLLQLFKYTSVKSIDFLTQYIDEEDIKCDTLDDFCKKNIRLNRLVFFNSPETRIINMIEGLTVIKYSKQKMFSDINCGNFHHTLFRVNQNMFLESQKYNSCLNKKLGIDRFGNVKNCPSMPYSFGSITNLDIENVIELDLFRFNWFLSKDKIKVCMDCEFRYMCVDCRAFLKSKNESNSKPLKCDYNPYTCKWETEST